MCEYADQNLARDLPMFTGMEAHNGKALIVGGGPSLAKQIVKLQFLRRRGIVFAVSAAHDWLIQRGIVPDYHVLLDSNVSTLDFVRNPHKDVTYLVAAQCHPKVFDALRDHNVIVWIADVEGMTDVVARYNDRPIVLVGGGGSVGLKTMCLAYLWGFRDLSLFGMDSAYANGAHHAYAQSVNDHVKPVPVQYEGKTFYCAPWMARQARDFIHDSERLKKRGVSIKTYGDGLIPHIQKAMYGR